MADKLTPAQRDFLMCDAYDEIWIGCPTPNRRRIGRNLAHKGLGVMRGIGLMARFHLNDVGREARAQLISSRAAELIGGDE